MGLDLIGLMEGALLVWSEFAKGFAWESLGEPSNFQVEPSGSLITLAHNLIEQ